MKRPRKTPVRFDLDLRTRGIASVPVLGCYQYSRAMPGLASHRHPGAIEICYLVRGRQVYEVGGRRYVLRGGDLFLTFPDEPHGTGGAPEEKGWLFWMSVLDPARTQGRLFGLDPGDSKALWHTTMQISKTGRRHFPGTRSMKSQLDALAELGPMQSSPLRKIQMLNLCTAFFLAVLDAQENARLSVPSSCLESVFSKIRRDLDTPEETTIPKLAAAAGLSVSRFQARFKEETGLPPAEFVLRARVQEAERRLKIPGTSVTRVAMDLGFSSSQYFCVAFQRITNRLPSELLLEQRTENPRLARRRN